jgi:hypothetical protein
MDPTGSSRCGYHWARSTEKYSTLLRRQRTPLQVGPICRDFGVLLGSYTPWIRWPCSTRITRDHIHMSFYLPIILIFFPFCQVSFRVHEHPQFDLVRWPRYASVSSVGADGKRIRGPLRVWSIFPLRAAMFQLVIWERAMPFWMITSCLPSRSLETNERAWPSGDLNAICNAVCNYWKLKRDGPERMRATVETGLLISLISRKTVLFWHQTTNGISSVAKISSRGITSATPYPSACRAIYRKGFSSDLPSAFASFCSSLRRHRNRQTGQQVS